LRLDFTLRHLPRPRRAAPVTIVRSFCSLCPSFASQFGGGRDKNLPPPTVEQRRDSEVSRLEKAADGAVRAASALGQPPQLHRVRLPRLHGELFVSLGGRWPARYCASNARRAAPTVKPIPTMPSSTFGPRRAIQRSPPEKQLRAAHRGWASRTLDAIVLHLLHCRCCIIHHATSARRMTVLIQLPLQTREFVRLDVNFLAVVPLARSDFHRYENPPCARLCSLLTGS
jgi:hypothetical protein